MQDAAILHTNRSGQQVVMAGRWNPVTTGTTGVKQKRSGGVFLAMPCCRGGVQNIFIEPHVIAHLVGPICVVRCESLQ